MVNVLYNEYTGSDEFERDLEIEFMKESVALDRTLLILHTIEESANIRAREAEIRCIEESGNIDVLEGYYREAAEEADEKKEGIVQKVWEFIKQMFKNLKEFLVGSKQAKKLRQDAANNVEYGLDDEGEESLSYIKKVTNAIHGGEGSLRALLKDKKTWLILTSTGAIAGGAVALNVAKHKHKAGELNGVMETIMKILDSGVEKLKSVASGVGSFLGKKAEEIGKTIIGWLGKAKDWILKIVGKFTGGSSDEEEKPEEGIDKEKARKQNNENRKISAEDEKALMSKEKLKEYDPEAYEVYTKRRQDLEKRFNTAKKNLQPGDKLNEAKKKYEEDKRALNAEFMVNLNESVDDVFEESVDTDDVFDIPDFLAEESVSEIDEISELLENL